MSLIHQERVWIDGPKGRLAGELAYGNGMPRATALLLSPHPYMGGKMRLPLMNRVAESLAASDITVLRFDYSGVGESQGPPVQIGAAMQQFWTTGSAPDDPIHIEEAAAARGWLNATTGRTDALIGYSFGSYVATRIHDSQLAAMVLIAPTVARHDYSRFDNRGTQTLVVYGDGDFATGKDQMHEWAARLPGPARLMHFAAGDHFFRGIEADVARGVCEFLECLRPSSKEVAG